MKPHAGSIAAIALVAVAAMACDSAPTAAGEKKHPAPATKAAPRTALDDLRALEDSRRAETDFATLPPAGKALGPDPVALERLPGTALAVGLVRGDDAVVVLDDAGTELSRLAAPASPSAMAMAGSTLFVSGDQSGTIFRYRIAAGKLFAIKPLAVPGVVAIKDVAAGPKGLLYALDGYDGDLLTVDSRTGRTATFGRCHRPLHVAYAGGLVLVDCLLDHEVRIFSTSAGGVPDPDPVAVIRHDGPIWSMDAAIAGHSLFVALGGVEDHPLFRDGAFGFIDSFVFAYEVDLSTFATERLLAVNVAEHQVITPKWVALSASAGAALSVDTAGYAGKNRAHIDFAGRGTEPVVTTWPLPPGTTDLVTFSGDQFIAANPLLDAWVVGHGATAVPKVVASQKSGPTRSIDERVGEALFFAGLMAPYNITTGRRSRFTCETCHFDGYIDGRTHYTTRGAVFSVTKPLRGLFNNRPHFSRALDRSMTQMVHNEFRVANAKSGHVPWFAIDTADYPWLRTFGAMPKTLYAIDLRRSLMAFLMIFTHDPNPAVRGRTGFDDREGRGASVFRERCEGCHQARLITDEPSTRVAFDGWEPLIFSPSGSIVWATAEYKKTGVRPYVHPRGARVFSLRRVYRKWPYFTNGSAKSLRAVLERARFSGTPGTDGARFFHDNAPADAHLSSLPAADIDPLIAFLRLL